MSTNDTTKTAAIVEMAREVVRLNERAQVAYDKATDLIVGSPARRAKAAHADYVECARTAAPDLAAQVVAP